MLSTFVTAKLKDQIEPRQGWVVSIFPLVIRGQSGAFYECEGELIEVINPPNCWTNKEER